MALALLSRKPSSGLRDTKAATCRFDSSCESNTIDTIRVVHGRVELYLSSTTSRELWYRHATRSLCLIRGNAHHVAPERGRGGTKQANESQPTVNVVRSILRLPVRVSVCRSIFPSVCPSYLSIFHPPIVLSECLRGHIPVLSVPLLFTTWL